MKIDDSLRNETTPEMVYSLCRLVASMKLPEDNVVKALSLGSDDDKTKMSVRKVISFAKKSEMIIENDSDNTLVCLFDNDDLVSFRSFRHALFMKAAPNEEVRFGKIVRWYLKQDPEVFKIENGEDLIQKIPNDIIMGDAQNARGFITWASGLGIMSRGYAGSKRAMLNYPQIHECISDWLYFDRPFPKGESILVRDFMQRMKSDCPLLQDTLEGNNIKRALSNALRILEGTGWIELKYTKDSGDVWHLTKSIARQNTNDITEIEVLR